MMSLDRGTICRSERSFTPLRPSFSKAISLDLVALAIFRLLIGVNTGMENSSSRSLKAPTSFLRFSSG